jgi:hypothetical protein
VTPFEHERLDLAVLTELDALGRILRPGTVTLQATTDKATQRQVLALAGFPVPPAIVAHDPAAVRSAVRATGYPAVLKAATTTLPVIGVPIDATALSGLDALLSIVQMPRGVPVATVAINGAANAAHPRGPDPRSHRRPSRRTAAGSRCGPRSRRHQSSATLTLPMASKT